jgi:lipopolysaccharide biosynthesis protein
LVFINAWNEWAEGAVLEPDTRLGFAWLEATRSALNAVAAPLPVTTTRPCAVIHAWHVDVVDEIAAALRKSNIDWRVIFTTAPECERALRERMMCLELDAEVNVFENRGRDILPFLHVANRLLDEGMDIVLKLHTKRSTHRDDGELWRRELIDKLISPDRGACVLEAFRTTPSLGLAAAEGHLQPLDDYIGANEANLHYLTTRLGIATPFRRRDQFIAGSMFWVRLDALRPVLDAHLGTWEFEEEAGQIDGTMAHAIERIIVLAAAAAGYRTKDTATICGLPSNSNADKPYPYARRSY